MASIGFKPILLFLVAAFLGAFGQYLYKTGAETSSGGLLSWLTNYRLISGALCYITIMILFILAFKIGGSLTILYPVYATTFIWALLIGVFLLKEVLTIGKVLGILLIIAGIFLTTR